MLALRHARVGLNFLIQIDKLGDVVFTYRVYCAIREELRLFFRDFDHHLFKFFKIFPQFEHFNWGAWSVIDFNSELEVTLILDENRLFLELNFESYVLVQPQRRFYLLVWVVDDQRTPIACVMPCRFAHEAQKSKVYSQIENCGCCQAWVLPNDIIHDGDNK